MKAVLLYPMNALATDQAIRINDLLTRPELKDVTAGPVHRRGARTRPTPGC